jgi:hypothetical protein
MPAKVVIIINQLNLIYGNLDAFSLQFDYKNT